MRGRWDWPHVNGEVLASSAALSLASLAGVAEMCKGNGWQSPGGKKPAELLDFKS